MLASPTFAGPDGRRPMTASSPWWCEWRLARTVASRHCARLVPLGPLDDSGVRTAVAAALGTADPPSELVTAVGERAGGSPFLIEELLASLVGVGALVRSGVGWKVRGALPAVVPESFAMAVADRLAALSTPARGVVELATVLGERFDWRLVACGCREPRHRLWPAPSRLADLNITVPDEGQHDRSIWPSDSPT